MRAEVPGTPRPYSLDGDATVKLEAQRRRRFSTRPGQARRVSSVGAVPVDEDNGGTLVNHHAGGQGKIPTATLRQGVGGPRRDITSTSRVWHVEERCRRQKSAVFACREDVLAQFAHG